MADKEDEKKQERVSIFIDGSNLYYSLKDLDVSKIDFQKLIDLLKKSRLLVSVYYYNAPLDITKSLRLPHPKGGGLFGTLGCSKF